jgi:hypothetical protein
VPAPPSGRSWSCRSSTSPAGLLEKPFDLLNLINNLSGSYGSEGAGASTELASADGAKGFKGECQLHGKVCGAGTW